MIKTSLAASIWLLLCVSAMAQKKPVVTIRELKPLLGTWQGTLNYHGTMIRKPYSTNALLAVSQIGKSNALCFVHTYGDDTSNKVIDTITLSRRGTMLRTATIKSKRKLKKGDLVVTTEARGFDHDNSTIVTIRQLYIIGKQHYQYKKQVRLLGKPNWLNREEFVYVR